MSSTNTWQRDCSTSSSSTWFRYYSATVLASSRGSGLRPYSSSRFGRSRRLGSRTSSTRWRHKQGGGAPHLSVAGAVYLCESRLRLWQEGRGHRRQARQDQGLREDQAREEVACFHADLLDEPLGGRVHCRPRGRVRVGGP